MSRPLLISRLAGLGTTIFAEMSELAATTGAVNLGQGFPDTDGPAVIARAAADAILRGLGNQYPPGAGVPELRQAIAEHQQRCYGLAFDPDTEVPVTAGATEAVAAALLALTEPGDEVIAFEPYYDSYAACIAMAGGVRIPVTLRPPRFPARHRSAAVGGHGADQGHLAELAAQPDRVGLHRRRARGDRGHRLRARPDRHRRRGVRAPGVRREPRADWLAAGDARAHRLDQLGRQDALVHRLEDRLGHRQPGPGGGGAR